MDNSQIKSTGYSHILIDDKHVSMEDYVPDRQLEVDRLVSQLIDGNDIKEYKEVV